MKKPRRNALPGDVLAAISRMALLQIDTINVVARSPYLVLFSRLGSYPQAWLDEALRRGSHECHCRTFLFPRPGVSICCAGTIEKPRRNALPGDVLAAISRMALLQRKYRAAWMHEHAEEIEQLVRHIQEHGPVRSADFEHAQKGASGWWEWKPHKRHLEGLFTAGKVMVVERRNFQRVYDLTRRVMPHWDDERDGLSQPQAESLMLDNSARSLGIFREQWLADYYRLKRPDLKGWRESRAEQQQIIPVEVETLGRMWLHADLLSQLEPALNNALKATHSAVLSPFDPVVWDRKRAAQLFAFDYRLECYTPAAKRQYGYFVLPLLYQGRLVGRMDAKMHRKTGVLEVISLYLEDDIRPGVSLQKGIWQAISAFAAWQRASRVTLGQCPPGLFSAMRHGWEIDPAP